MKEGEDAIPALVVFSVITAALIWCAWLASQVSGEEPGIYIQGQPVGCRCEACNCTNCQCAGVCTCPTCKSRLQVQPFGVSEDLPVEVVLVTAHEWCPPCAVLAPFWAEASANNPVCRTLDISDREGEAAKEARKYGVRNIPALLRLVDGKVERSVIASGMTAEGLKDTIKRWGKR